MKIKALIIAAVIMSTAAISCKTGTAGIPASALDSSLWEYSEWISAADAPIIEGIVHDNDLAADGSSWFVRSIRNESKVVSAKWMSTGLGVFDLYLNGRTVGEEILKPGFTHNEKTKRSFTYDITEAINKAAGAENVFSAQLTPGWWADMIVTLGGSNGMMGTRCAFRCVIELCFADGSKRTYGTNTEDWKAGIAGPVKHAAIFDGETYDARQQMGYESIASLGKPIINDEFHGVILPSEGAEIYFRKDLTLSPVKAYVWEGIHGASEQAHGSVNIVKEYRQGETITLLPGQKLVVDFGQNCSAVPQFEFKAAEGTCLTCLPAELLNDGNGAFSRGMDGPQGSCHRSNLRAPDSCMALKYIFSGKGTERFLPRNTFFGYRYVSISATDKVTIKSIRSVPVTSITKEMEIGSITTGNTLVNRLIQNTLWGQRSNYLSVPSDCPQRNERQGWMADTQVFAETGTFFANTASFFHKWMQDVMDTQSPSGAYPGVAPIGQIRGEYMRLGWADAGIIVPCTVWKQFNDREIVGQCWDSMEKYMDHVAEAKYHHLALCSENGNYQWADWLSYEALESCSNRMKEDFNSTLLYWDYLCACYWYIDSELMRDAAAAIGKDAAKYQAMLDEAQERIRHYLTPEGEFTVPVLNTMQTPALFALRCKAVEGQAKERLCARLRKNFEEHDNCLQTGFLGTSILLNTLSDNGMEDIAYELLFQRKCPSWLYSVDNGATTIWERWNSYTIESGMGPQSMNSFNHYAYGCVCEWIWERAAGICADPAAPGFRHIVMKPLPDRRLGFLKAEYKSASGTIVSEWKYEGDEWIWKVRIPEGCSASITLPGETISKEYLAGEYKFKKRI